MNKTLEKKVLIIDDEEIIRVTLKDALEDEGYTALIADNGEEGLDVLRADPSIKIAICDIMMPKVDGIEFLRRVRYHLAICVEIILVTGHSTMEKCLEAIEIGICGYLCKPFNIEDVLNNVRRAERNIEERKNMVSQALNETQKQQKRDVYLPDED